MTNTTQTPFNNPEALPPFLRDVEIIGPASSQFIENWQMYAKASAPNPLPGEVSVETMPILRATPEVMKAYRSGNFKKIKELQDLADNDIDRLHEHLKAYPETGWLLVRARDGSPPYYMAANNTAMIWSRTIDEYPDPSDKLKRVGVVQLGTYSQSAGIIGLKTFKVAIKNIGQLIQKPGQVMAHIVGIAVSYVLGDSVGFIAAEFAKYMTKAAALYGLSIAFNILPFALSALSVTLTFAVVFIGLQAIYHFLFRNYTISLEIMNWDEERMWRWKEDIWSNAKIVGDVSQLKFALPKRLKRGDSVVVGPPGLMVDSLEEAVHYGVVIFENDHTFLQGCAMAMTMEKMGVGETTGTGQGFSWAFECLRFSKNKHKLVDGLQNPQVFLKDKHGWTETSREIKILSTPEKTPVSSQEDSSARDRDFYSFIVQIGVSDAKV